MLRRTAPFRLTRLFLWLLRFSTTISDFVDLSEEIGNQDIMVEKDDDGKEKVLEMTIEELDLSVRSFNCLKRAGINTVEDLISKIRGRYDEG